MLILGYILVAVSINVMGDIEGKSLNYYNTYEECMLDGLEQKELSPPGISYACVEDYLR
tara:strand:- start:286 stop:462 length:177 start_codon:yes stop_codon:yes gene_type:complete